MSVIGGSSSSAQEALQAVHTQAKSLAGAGKIKYTHVLEAFRRVYGDARFQGVFKGQALSTDLERAVALATLVEQVAQMSNADQQQVKAVGHALRRWTSLGAETKRKIDQVFQTQVLRGKENRWTRFKDKVAEFFHDLGALISQSRLSTPEDIDYADKVSHMMEQGFGESKEVGGLNLPKPKNRTQREFLKSAEKMYRQRFSLVGGGEIQQPKDTDLAWDRFEEKSSLNFDGMISEFDRRISTLKGFDKKTLQGLDRLGQAKITQGILYLQARKAAYRYYRDTGLLDKDRKDLVGELRSLCNAADQTISSSKSIFDLYNMVSRNFEVTQFIEREKATAAGPQETPDPTK